MAVKNFYVKNVGKVYRSCGNCSKQYARKSTFDNIRVEGASVVAGVNSNYGDSTSIRNSCVVGSKVCFVYTGNNNGKEPTKIASGPTGTACVAAAVKTSGC